MWGKNHKRGMIENSIQLNASLLFKDDMDMSR